MIYSISGKLSSGKDSVAIIIDALMQGLSDKSIKDLVQIGTYRGYYFENIKWADKVKDITCLMLGCTRKQLENQEFKNKELGEEWWYWKVYSNITQDKFEIIPYNGESGFYDRKENYKGHLLVKLTPRLFMQLLGTDCFRNIIHPNSWVNATMKDYKTEYQDFEHDARDSFYPIIIQKQSKWIISDTRFENEVEAVKAKGGINIRINRKKELRLPELWNEYIPSNDTWNDFLRKKELYDTIYHTSETSLDSYQDWDYVIDNDSTIESLIEKVRDILIKKID